MIQRPIMLFFEFNREQKNPLGNRNIQRNKPKQKTQRGGKTEKRDMY